ncbi:MAG TPA: BatA domain-containing protein [Thermoanaerobaculia bacterium]|nr:BatA domain-containing protein [Thermoanaerobaculia bacterium]
MIFERLSPGVAVALLVGVAAIVALLYWLRPPARAVRVASVLPWLRLAERSKRSRRWRRLLSLVISLAAASAMALALGGLRVVSPGADAPPLVLLIDTSATMATATDAGGTRLERALAEARGEIARSRGPVDLYDTTGQLAHAGLPIAAALDLLARLRVHPARPAVFPAAAAAPDDARPRRRLYLSDGVASLSVPQSFERISVWRPAVNVGIVAFEAARSGDRLEAFVEVLNGSPGTVQTEILLATVDGATLVRRTLELASLERWSGILDLAPLGAQLATAPVLHALLRTPGDALALDDEAWAPVPLGAPLRVAVAGPPATATRRLLGLLPGVEVRAVEPEQLETLGTEIDVVVLEEVAPERAPAHPTLLVAPPDRDWLPAREAELGPSAWTAGRPSESTARAASPAASEAIVAALVDLRVESIVRYAAAPDAARIDGAAWPGGPETATLPLLLSGPGGGDGAQPWVLLPFSIEASNLTHHEGFPEMLLALLLDLVGVGGTSLREPGVLEVPAGALGRRDQVAATEFHLGSRHFAEIETPALLAGPGPRSWQAVAPPGPAATAVNRTDWPAAPATSPGTVAVLGGNAPSWRSVLLAAALALVSLELWTRTRGITE